MLKQILLFVILFSSVVTILAQKDQKIKIQVDERGDPIVTPEMEAIIMKRQGIGRNLDSYVSFSAKAATLNATPKNDAIRISRQSLNDLKFEFFLENKTQTQFELIFNDVSQSIRPELKLNGKIVNYSEDKIKHLQSKADGLAAYRVDGVTFPPATKQAIPNFAGIGNLQKWYDPLDAGFYELTFSYRFGINQDGTKKSLLAQPIFLEILPD
jgi:hypothetical protein